MWHYELIGLDWKAASSFIVWVDMLSFEWDWSQPGTIPLELVRREKR